MITMSRKNRNGTRSGGTSPTTRRELMDMVKHTDARVHEVIDVVKAMRPIDYITITMLGVLLYLEK